MGFSGYEIPIPIGTGGFNANQNTSQVLPSQLIVARNLTYENGNIQREGGAELFTPPNTPTYVVTSDGSFVVTPNGSFDTVPGNADALPGIAGGHDFWPTPAVQRSIVVCIDGSTHKDSGAGTYPTSLSTGLNPPDQPPIFVDGGKESTSANKKCFIYTGTNQVQTFSGDATSIANIALPPSDWSSSFPTCGTVHMYRHFGAGNPNNPHAVYYSTAANMENLGGAIDITGDVDGSTAVITNVSDTSNLEIGGSISGTGIPAGSIINSFTSNTITISTATTSMGSEVAITCFSPNTGVIQVDSSVGLEIMSLFSFMGNLIVFKYPRGIYQINTAGLPNPDDWTVQKITDTIGICSQNGAQAADDDILFMDASGHLHFLTTVREYGDYGMMPMSDLYYIQTFLNANVNIGDLGSVQSVAYTAKREIHFLLSQIGTTSGGLRLVVDFNITGTPRFRWSDKDAIQAIWGFINSDNYVAPRGGDGLGQVWNLDADSTDQAGSPYTSQFQTPHLDMGSFNPLIEGKNKNFKFIDIVSDIGGNWAITLDIFIDGDYTQTVSANLGIAGASLGSFVLGTSALGGGSIVSTRIRIEGEGRRISIAGSLATVGTDFAIANLIIGFTVGSEANRG